MTYIHQLPDWPRFQWSAERLAGPLAAVRNAQGRHLGKMETLGFSLQEEACLEVLTSDVVQSWAIEGERLDAREVRSSIASQLGLDVGGLPAAGREVEGIVEMMLDATQNHALPVTAERMHGWHAALFPTGRSGLGGIIAGAWRTAEAGPMQVVSGSLGHESVHFEAPHADLLEGEMRTFTEWLEQPHSRDPVLQAGIAHLWFLTLHPFEDGNGRIARALADLHLARADGTKSRFYSLSTRIERERKDYYRELEAAQRGGLDITTWLLWFIACLGRSIAGAEQTLSRVLHKAQLWQRLNLRAVNDRQRKVMHRLLDDFEGHLTSSKYAKLAKCSPDSALRDVRDLLERGVLVQNPGGGRSTSYRLASAAELAD